MIYTPNECRMLYYPREHDMIVKPSFNQPQFESAWFLIDEPKIVVKTIDIIEPDKPKWPIIREEEPLFMQSIFQLSATENSCATSTFSSDDLNLVLDREPYQVRYTFNLSVAPYFVYGVTS